MDPERQPDEREPEAPPPPNGHARRRRSLRALGARHPRGVRIGLLLAAVLLVGGLLFWRYLASYQSTDDAQVDAHISSVGARINGTVIAVYVEDNQEVQAGQLLVELDPRDAQVALERALADLAQAEAQVQAARPNVPITSTSTEVRIATVEDTVTDARAQVVAGERDRESARARVRDAQATRTKAQADLTRARFLLGERAIPKQRYDDALAAARSASATVDSNRALAEAARKAVEQQRARLSQALSRRQEAQTNAPHELQIQHATVDARQGAVQAARAVVAQARLNLEYTKVRAPVGGIVGRRAAEVGARVQAGEDLLAIVELDNVWVTANFKETQLKPLAARQRARIHVDALSRDFDGEVETFGAATGARFSLLPPENATGNFVKVVQRVPVRIRFCAPREELRRLRPGMSVEPKVWVQ